MSQRTLVDNVLHGFWCHTAAVRNSGLAPPDNVDCTSTLSRLELVQRWPVSSRKVKARRTDRWLSYEGVVHNISYCPLITSCRIGWNIQWRWVQPDDRQAAGCSVMSVLSGNLSFPWTLVSSLAVASCHRRCGGGMFLRTGNHGSGVELWVPVIVHIDVFNWMSSSLVWDDLDQTGAE